MSIKIGDIVYHRQAEELALVIDTYSIGDIEIAKIIAIDNGEKRDVLVDFLEPADKPISTDKDFIARSKSFLESEAFNDHKHAERHGTYMGVDILFTTKISDESVVIEDFGFITDDDSIREINEQMNESRYFYDILIETLYEKYWELYKDQQKIAEIVYNSVETDTYYRLV